MLLFVKLLKQLKYNKVVKIRSLTVKQKKLIKIWHKQKEPTTVQKECFGMTNSLCSVQDLTDEQYEMLVKINDTEILHQEVNRFISDLE